MKADTAPDDEPIIVLVLFVVAGLTVLGGLIVALEYPAEGISTGVVCGSFTWAAGVVIRILHRIERNTRRLGRHGNRGQGLPIPDTLDFQQRSCPPQ